MPKFLERKLKEEYGEKSAIPYKVMNSMGAMHGSKETAKGREMEKKHMKDSHMREMRIEIHRGKDGKVSGHTVHHHMMPKATGKSHAFLEETHHSFPFGPKEHDRMMDHIEEHLGILEHAAHDVTKGAKTGKKAEKEMEEDGE